MRARQRVYRVREKVSLNDGIHLLSTQVLIKVVTASICKFMCLHKRKMCFDVYQLKFFHWKYVPRTINHYHLRWMNRCGGSLKTRQILHILFI